MRFFNKTFRISYHSRQEPGDRFNHCDSRNFATVENIVANADELDSLAARIFVNYSLINAFIPTTSEDQMGFPRELVRHRLGKHLSSR